MVITKYENKPANFDQIKSISSNICFDINHHHSFLQAPYFFLMISSITTLGMITEQNMLQILVTTICFRFYL